MPLKVRGAVGDVVAQAAMLYKLNQMLFVTCAEYNRSRPYSEMLTDVGHASCPLTLGPTPLSRTQVRRGWLIMMTGMKWLVSNTRKPCLMCQCHSIPAISMSPSSTVKVEDCDLVSVCWSLCNHIQLSHNMEKEKHFRSENMWIRVQSRMTCSMPFYPILPENHVTWPAFKLSLRVLQVTINCTGIKTEVSGAEAVVFNTGAKFSFIHLSWLCSEAEVRPWNW